MSGDLFTSLNSLFNKQPVQDHVPTFILHRFLASDPDYAIAARYFQRDFRGDDKMLIQAWRGLLPYASEAPRFSYVAPKKSPPAEKLVTEMMLRLHERRDVVEEIISMFELQRRELELYHAFGVQSPKEPSPKPKPGVGEPAKPKRGGLLAD